MASAQRTGLGARLRELRQEHGLTQGNLARVLGVAVSSVSQWESGVKVPPVSRIGDYATFFASGNPARNAKLPAVASLSDEQRRARADIKEELEALRAQPQGSAGGEEGSDFWRFPDGGPVRILTGRVPARNLSPLASPERRNYIGMSAYADGDALIELYGHVRALNPSSDVRFEIARRIDPHDLQAHLVLLGSPAMNPMRRQVRFGLPVRQVEVDDLGHGEIFEVAEESRQYRPTLHDGRLIEDVGLLARFPNPYNVRRTLTLCSGVFTRGGFGAVRCLTDPELRARNHEHLKRHIADSDNFGMLMRVPVVRNATATPDLSNPDTWIRAWSPIKS
ncbi:helix-turn-helix domain-containing protein [Saccharopolyspora mangrovi]|uniref:Helix-turn-helix transcriptional regulator n=1 Tax=Saccharopolyspora mangrovi TaxID=3082379 RepID=A0ABU6AFZ8_9PSEU|nr:helix-turn-helix transcriptional regulator [Saccharopolyspora sp. S2-29]MEB3370366.1 helix-turn-helix transcriptional regulator [Saccharopolyspora sp. S2-29]